MLPTSSRLMNIGCKEIRVEGWFDDVEMRETWTIRTRERGRRGQMMARSNTNCKIFIRKQQNIHKYFHSATLYIIQNTAVVIMRVPVSVAVRITRTRSCVAHSVVLTNLEFSDSS
jgi:hypothetical protein